MVTIRDRVTERAQQVRDAVSSDNDSPSDAGAIGPDRAPGGSRPADDPPEQTDNDSPSDAGAIGPDRAPGGSRPADEPTESTPDTQTQTQTESEPISQGVQSEEASELRQEIAGRDESYDASDVRVEQRDDGGLRGFVPQERVAEVEIEEAASESEVYSEEDFAVDFDGGTTNIFVPEATQQEAAREQAASASDIYNPEDFNVESTEEGFKLTVEESAEVREIQEAATADSPLSPDQVTVEPVTLGQSPIAGNTPPDDSYTVTADESAIDNDPAIPTSDDEISIEEAQESAQADMENPELISSGETPQTDDFGQTTDTTFSPSDHPDGFADALIDTDAAQSVSDAGSFVSGAVVERAQDAGEFIASGQGSDDAGVVGDVVGGGFEGRASGLADVVTGPIEGTPAEQPTRSVIEGAFGSAPAAIARTPGDVALLTRRSEQSARTIASDPAIADDVAASAVGYGAAGASATAGAVADRPIREGVSIGALLGATAGAGAGVRATGVATRARSAGASVRAATPDVDPRIDELIRDTRGQSQIPDDLTRAGAEATRERGATRRRDESETPTITAEDLRGERATSEPVSDITRRQGGESRATDRGRGRGTRGSDRTRISEGPRGARTPEERATAVQEPEVRIDDGMLTGAAIGGMVGVSDASDTAQSAVQRERMATEQAVGTRGTQGIRTGTQARSATQTDIDAMLGIQSVSATQTSARTRDDSVSNLVGRGSGRSRRGPALPDIPDMTDDDPASGFETTFDDEFAGIDVGSYIDPI